MDSKIVSKKIKDVIKPYMQQKGFTLSNSRNFWRYSGSDIHVLNFQSFNSYNASVLGVSTFSYCINLGLYVKEIDCGYPIKEKDGVLMPQEYECHFRGSIRPSISQSIKDKSIWFIKEDGSNLDECIHDSLKQIKNEIDIWFDQLNTRNKKIQVVENINQDMKYLWGWGNNPSPHRALILSILYFPIDKDKSLSFLDEVIKGPSYKELFKTKEQGIKYLEKIYLPSASIR